MRRLRPQLMRIERSQLHAKPWGVIEQHANCFRLHLRQHRPVSISQTDPSQPGDRQTAARRRLKETVPGGGRFAYGLLSDLRLQMFIRLTCYGELWRG